MSLIVSARNLTLGYNGKAVITGASFDIESKQFVFLTGVSGSGKTTVVKSIYGEISPIGGRLSVGGYEMNGINRASLRQLRRFLGIVFQDYKLVPEWNVLRNVTLPLIIAGYDKRSAEEKALHYLEKVQMADKADRFPFELSGGEQQRVAMVRAIIHEPVLLVADEPLSGLDFHSAQLVMDLFQWAHQLGITVLIATHSIPEHLIPGDLSIRQLHIENRKVNELL
ncbi:MAG: ABC transporter ATP-binding protein [Epsilonproteobacteria bacterium]|jgi:cell division transport system ATP-binding protein|nr:ABC transporter ATP-binding protein [Campylobacterota bacterium]NPA89609.1 ATP-binding cassette domain-containing protein [Campylobacterota bacterium]